MLHLFVQRSHLDRAIWIHPIYISQQSVFLIIFPAAAWRFIKGGGHVHVVWRVRKYLMKTASYSDALSILLYWTFSPSGAILLFPTCFCTRCHILFVDCRTDFTRDSSFAKPSSMGPFQPQSPTGYRRDCAAPRIHNAFRSSFWFSFPKEVGPFKARATCCGQSSA